MKKKLKAMKRRWRKLHKGDRVFYRGQAVVALLTLLLLPFAWIAVISLMWVAILVLTYTNELRHRRVFQFIWYYKGRWRQIALDRTKLAKAASLRLQYDRLYSDHSKLRYDYNQLKKLVNKEQNKKNKKNNKPFNKKRNEQQK